LHQESSSFDLKQQILTPIGNFLRDIQLSFHTDNRELATPEFGFAGIINAPAFGLGIYIFSAINFARDGKFDIFFLGLKQSNALNALVTFQENNTYKTDDDYVHVWMEDDILHFSFRYQHSPSDRHEVVLSRSDSADAIKWLSFHSGTSRNTLCPCGSGGKFKKCCAQFSPDSFDISELEMALNLSGSKLPPEVKWMSEIESDDEELADLILAVTADHNLLGDSKFWRELGEFVGTLGENDRSIECFRKVLQLDPSDHGAKLNLAVLSSGNGDHEEALNLIREVPEGTHRRLVINANILSDQGLDLDAIPLYELAIFEEPDFWLPYARLLTILERHQHPLYEYWVDQSVRMLPASPWIAYHFARNRWGDHRLTELAEADWFDDLIEETDRTVIGRPDFKSEAMRARILRDAAKCSFDPNRDSVEELALAISTIDSSEHLCDEGKFISMLFAKEGYPDLIPDIYDRVCDDCTSEEIGGIPKSVNILLASAYFQLQSWGLVIDHSEKAYVDLPENDQRLGHMYFWALDEVGRTEEAVKVAKELLESNPDMPYLNHNLGVMNQHFGRLGEATYYYEQQLEQEEHSSSKSGLTFILLLDRKYEEARSSFREYEGLLSDVKTDREFYLKDVIEYVGRSTERDYQNPEIVDIAQKTIDDPESDWLESHVVEYVAKIRTTFDQLLEFAEANRDSPTYVVDLINKNQSFHEFQLGPDTRLRPEPYSLNDVLKLASHGSDEHAYQTRFSVQLEQSGDYSIFHQSLIDEVQTLDHLPRNAKYSLLEGEKRYTSTTPMIDYSTVVNAFAKSVEITLKQTVFERFRSLLASTSDFEHQIGIALQNEKSQAKSLFTFLSKSQFLELGAMAHLLRLCGGSTADKEYLVGKLRDFIISHPGGLTLLESGNIEVIAQISKELRNPASHSDIIEKYQSDECRHLCIKILNILEEFTEIYSSEIDA